VDLRGSDTVKSIYIDKIGNIKDKMDLIHRRFTFQQLPEAAESLNKVIAYATELARSAHDKYSHITITMEREKVLEQCRTGLGWRSSEGDSGA